MQQVDHLRLVKLPHPLYDWGSRKVISSMQSSQWWKTAGFWHQRCKRRVCETHLLDFQDCYSFSRQLLPNLKVVLLSEHEATSKCSLSSDQIIDRSSSRSTCNNMYLQVKWSFTCHLFKRMVYYGHAKSSIAGAIFCTGFLPEHMEKVPKRKT